MDKRKRNIAAFFLLVYMPVAMGISFIHSHALSEAGENKLTHHESATAPLSFSDSYCAICKFISSQTPAVQTHWQGAIHAESTIRILSFAQFAFGLLNATDDRAPPFRLM